jgi:hypothetical protein
LGVEEPIDQLLTRVYVIGVRPSSPSIVCTRIVIGWYAAVDLVARDSQLVLDQAGELVEIGEEVAPADNLLTSFCYVGNDPRRGDVLCWRLVCSVGREPVEQGGVGALEARNTVEVIVTIEEIRV